jgi:hypothetical protein
VGVVECAAAWGRKKKKIRMEGRKGKRDGRCCCGGETLLPQLRWR